MSSLVILAASVFEISCEKNRCRQKEVTTRNPASTTAVDVRNKFQLLRNVCSLVYCMSCNIKVTIRHK